MKDFEQTVCRECGNSKFKAYENLDPEEKTVADRRLSDFEPDVAYEGRLVCSRCFTVRESGEIRA